MALWKNRGLRREDVVPWLLLRVLVAVQPALRLRSVGLLAESLQLLLPPEVVRFPNEAPMVRAVSFRILVSCLRSVASEMTCFMMQSDSKTFQHFEYSSKFRGPFICTGCHVPSAAQRWVTNFWCSWNRNHCFVFFS